MPEILYAAYGSNLHPARLLARTPTAQVVGTATLPGYAVRFRKQSLVDRSGKCDLFPADGEARVAVYALSTADKLKLDTIEGVGKGYDQVEVDVPGFGRCVTYRAQPEYVDETLRPFHWYKTLVLLGCAFHGFDDGYVETVRRVAATADLDAARRAENQRLIEQIRNGR